jgi:hypothetical protein
MKLLCLLITLLLTACGGAEGGGADASFIIQPNSTSGLEYQLNEGDITNKIISLRFVSGISGELNYATFNIDAVAKSDYLPTSGTLQVSAGNEYTIDVEIYADERVEGDEKLGVELTSTVDEFSLEFVISIINDDFPEYTVTSVDITEGNIGTQLSKVTIDLKEDTVDPYSLTLKTLQTEAIGYGLAGSDYVALEQELVFLEGELSKEVSLEIMGDLAIEPDELIEFVISDNGVDSTPYSFAIRSDDFPGQGAPTFIVNNNLSLSVAENGTNQIFQMPFSIDETGGFSEPLTLFYYLREIDPSIAGVTDTSELDQDFLLNKTLINISPNQTDYIAEFTVIDDGDLENVEVFELVLANEAGVEFGSGRIYISDNESPAFKIYRQYSDSAGNLITSNDLEYLESSNGIGEHKIIVELLGAAGYDFEFEYSMRLANAGEVTNAVNAADWEQVVTGSIVQSNRLTIEKGNSFPRGSEADGISFTINSDTLVEGNESFFIELKNTNGSAIGEAVEVKILNDDLPEVRWVNDAVALPATVADPFKVNEGDDLNLKLKLIGATGLGDAALETFNISINRQDSNIPLCAWRNSSDLINSELVITNEADQLFSQTLTNIPVSIQSVEDNQVECDEAVTLAVVLSSNNPGVNNTTQDDIVVTVVNDDIAQLDVYGFTASETTASSDFIISLNTDVEVDIEFLLDYAGAESSDANHLFDSTAVNVGSGIKTGYQFDESFNQRSKALTSQINNDDIVELDESYQLSVYLKPSASPIPIELRQCVIGNTPECAVIADPALPAIVLGTINSEDKVTLSLVAKGSETVLESSLTALALLDSTVASPYEIQLDKAIASDVPAMTVLLTDRCILLSADDCASVDDYSILSTPVHDGASDTPAGALDLQFKLLLDDSVVEPSEVAKLLLTLNNEAGLVDYIANWSDQTIDFSFTDDDKLIFTTGDTGLATPVAVSYAEGADAASLILGYGIRWDKDIAANVPAISLLISENCDEAVNDLCVVTSVNTNVLSGDIAGTTNIVIHDSTGVTPKNISGLSFGIEITGDDVIEPDESTTLLISLNDAVGMQPFINGASWPDETISFSIINDDQLTMSLSQVSSSVTEGNIGDLNSAGILLSWDKDIAANMGDISLTITEQCDNLANSHCISDVLNEDIQFPNATINLHQKNSATAAASNQDIGITISGDTLIEPNERIELLFSLQNSISVNPYLITPWADQTINVTVDNDDVLIPQLAFVDDADIAEGDEDTDKDLSAGNNVGLLLTWGSAVIADNTDDLIFEITDICADCGLANSDYTIDAGDINLASKVSGGQLVLGFAITTDSMVEPNEIVAINLLKKSSTPAHYFSSIPVGNKFSELSYTINNDERLRVKVIRTDGLTTSDLPEAQASPLTFSWLGHAASNLPDLSIGLIEECDNDDGDNALQKCLAQSTSLNNSPADISLVSTAVIKNTGSEQDASTIAVTGTLGISQNDDDWVEISEALQLKFTIAANLQDYLRFDIAGSTEASPLFESLRSYTLVSDDILNVTFTNASSSGAITDESAEASIVYSLGFDKSVEQDVAALELEFIDASTPGQRYAIRSNSFATAADYRVFFDGLVAENIVNTSLVIKAAGQSLSSGNKSLTLTVGDDDLVEADEIVAFSLKENNALLSLFDMGIELTQNVASTERSFSILLEDQLAPAIRFSADLVSAEVLSQVETDSDDSAAAIISGLTAIDSNIGTLTVNASISCKVGGPVSCSSSEASIDASIDLDPATLTTASIIDLGFVITGDQIIEPDEELTLTLSVASNTEYFNLPSAASRDFTILNDDYLSISLTDSSSPIVEGDLSDAANTIDLVIADEGGGIEGLVSIDYTISGNTIAGQDNAEGNGSVKDYAFSGSPGSRTIDLTAMQAPSTATISYALATINVDHHIEADEIFDITVNIALASEHLAPASSTSFNAQYTISDDDYLTVVMKDLAAQAEDNESLKVLVCDKEGGAVESDFVLDFATQTAFLDVTLDDYLPLERRAILDTDYTVSGTTLSVSQSEISNSNLYLTNHCALKDLPVDFTTDTVLENDEWFGFSLSSTTSYLCADAGNNCLQDNLVIVNDEIQAVLDSGVTQCITSTGTVAAMSAGVCSGLSIQDVEVEYPENKYTFIGSSGTPLLSQLPVATEVPPTSYDCISDNYSGLLWSTSRLPFDGTHSADGKSWAGSIIANSTIFEGLFSASGFCGYLVDTKKWQLPSVEELVGTLNYENLENDGVFLPGDFINEELSAESIYWSSDDCDTDSDVATKEYWAVNMKNGTVTCAAEASNNLIRAVYY